MKFRYKVLICNIIFVAIAFAVSGFLLIRYTYRIGIERSVNAVLEENQLLRTTIEADITGRILSEDYESLSDIDRLRSGIEDRLAGTQTKVDLIVSVDLTEDSPYYPLVQALESGRKNYVIRSTSTGYDVACASALGVENSSFYIINTKDISDVFESMDLQINYYRIIMLFAIVICSIIMLFIATYMTDSIQRLTRVTKRMAGGDYEIRTKVRSRDEIGELSHNFNKMADSVEGHVRQLEEENRRREDFVANFTHEIKTPLTAVIGYSDMLRSKHMKQENIQLAAEYIFSEGKRLESMSMKLFDLILLDKQEIVKKGIYVPDLTDTIQESVRPVIEKRNIRLVVKSCPVWICGDSDLLKTVFINMLDNASKASKSGDTVMLRVRCRNNVVLFEVIDRGIGIPAEDVARITEAFYMVDKSRSRQSGGAGLGMALASKIIGVHGGRLKILSEVGRGTCMQVFFKQSGPKWAASETGTRQPGGRGK